MLMKAEVGDANVSCTAESTGVSGKTQLGKVAADE